MKEFAGNRPVVPRVGKKPTSAGRLSGRHRRHTASLSGGSPRFSANSRRSCSSGYCTAKARCARWIACMDSLQADLSATPRAASGVCFHRSQRSRSRLATSSLSLRSLRSAHFSFPTPVLIRRARARGPAPQSRRQGAGIRSHRAHQGAVRQGASRAASRARGAVVRIPTRAPAPQETPFIKHLAVEHPHSPPPNAKARLPELAEPRQKRGKEALSS